MGGGMRGMTSALKKVQQQAAELKKNKELATSRLDELKTLIDEARGIDTDMSAADLVFQKSRAAFDGKDYKLALQEADAATEKAISLYRGKILELLDSSGELVGLAQDVGVDVSIPEGLLKEARTALDAGEFKKSIELGRKGWGEVETVMNEQVSVIFSAAQSRIHLAKESDIDTTTAAGLVEAARTAIEANDFTKAFKTLKEARTGLDDELQEHLIDLIDEAEQRIAMATDLKADPATAVGLVGEANAALETGDLESALKNAKAGRDEADREVNAIVQGRVDNTQRMINDAIELGTEMGRAEEIIVNAQATLKTGDYSGTLDQLRQADEEAQNAQFQFVLRLVSLSRAKFIEANKIGADITKAVNFLNKARDALKKKRFKESVDFARQGDLEVDRVIRTYHRAKEAIETFEKYLSGASAAGLDQGDLKGAYEKAKTSFETGQYETVLGVLDEAKTEAEGQLYDSSMSHIEAAEDMIAIAERLGIDYSAENNSFEQAIDLVNDKLFSEAIANCNGILEGLQAKSHDLLQGKISDISIRIQRMSAERRDPLTGDLERARGELENGDFGASYRLLTEVVDHIDAERGKVARVKLEKLQANMVAAEMMELSTAVYRSKMEAVESKFKAKDFDQAEKTLNPLLVEVEKAIKLAISTMFNDAKAKLIAAKKNHINVEPMKNFLKEGKQFFELSQFKFAIEKIQESIRLTQDSVLLREESRSAIKEVAVAIVGAKKTGLDVEEATRILTQAKELLKTGQYRGAVDTCQTALRHLSSQKEIEGLSGSVKRVEDLLETGRALGLDVTSSGVKVKLLIGKIENQDVLGANQILSDVGVELETTVGQAIADLAGRVDAALQDAESIGISMGSLREVFDTARGALESEALVMAVQRFHQVEADLDLMKELAQNAAKEIGHAQEVLSRAADVGIDLAQAEARIAVSLDHLKSNRYEESISVAQELVTTVDAEARTKVQESLRRFQASIAEAQGQGTDVSTAESLLHAAHDALENQHYSESLRYVMESERELEDVSLQRDMSDKALETASMKIDQLVAAGLDGSALQGEVEKATALHTAGNYVEALSEAIYIGERLDDLGERVGAAKTLLDDVSAEHGASAPVAPVADAELRLSQAREMLARGDTGEVTGILEALREDIAAALATQATADSAAIAADFGNFDALGGNSKAFRDLITELGEEATIEKVKTLGSILSELRKGIDFRIEEKFREAIARIQEAQARGIQATEIEETMLKARQLHQDRDLTALIALLPDLEVEFKTSEEEERNYRDYMLRLDSLLSTAKKFRLNMEMALELRAKAEAGKEADLVQSISILEQAVVDAERVIDAFSPSLEAAVNTTHLDVGEWTPVDLTILNSGKVLGKDVRIEASGPVEFQEVNPIPLLKAGGEEHRSIQLRALESGKLEISINLYTTRFMDGKSYSFRFPIMFRAEVKKNFSTAQALQEDRCQVCRGMIKIGLQQVTCLNCQSTYHEMCANRAKSCPTCQGRIADDEPAADSAQQPPSGGGGDTPTTASKPAAKKVSLPKKKVALRLG